MLGCLLLLPVEVGAHLDPSELAAVEKEEEN